MSAPTSPKTPTGPDRRDDTLRTALTKLADEIESREHPAIVYAVVDRFVDLLAAHPAPTPGEDHLDAACAWSDFRKDYGVSGDDKVRRREHRAFMAGWQSARGTIDAGGVQR